MGFDNKCNEKKPILKKIKLGDKVHLVQLKMNKTDNLCTNYKCERNT